MADSHIPPPPPSEPPAPGSIPSPPPAPAPPDARPAAIIVEHLTKRFDKLIAVNDISFFVPQGEFFGFLGPNGAGKSTTIRVLCGLLRAEYTRIEVAGHDLRSDQLGVKASIGVMLEDPVLYERLSAREHLRFTGELYGLSQAEADRRGDRLLSMLSLADDADRLIVDYSQGMRKKVALACALIHEPPVLFLDEPFSGIDTVSSRQIKDLLRARVDQGVTILFSSHVMEVVERLCTGVAIIHQGSIAFADTMANLQARPDFDSLEDVFIRAVGQVELIREEDQSWLGE